MVKNRNRPPKYKPKNNDAVKDKYSLSDLVAESTGVNNNMLEYAAAYKSVQRIISVIERFINCSIKPVSNESKPVIIKLIRALYQTDDELEVLAAIRNSKKGAYPLNSFEPLEWQLVDFLGFIEGYRNTPKPLGISEMLAMQSVEFRKHIQQIEKRLLEDLIMVCNMDDEQEKIDFIHKYRDIIEDPSDIGPLGKWRLSLEPHKLITRPANLPKRKLENNPSH